MHLTVCELLGESGPIAERMRQRLGDAAYETRPEQVRMGEAVARTLEKRSRLLVEAGTGVGKSFAYLVPAILRCIERGEKVVIATSTIALQEQLVQKDIPLLVETLAKWGSAPATESRSGDAAERAPRLEADEVPARLASLALRQVDDAKQDEKRKKGPPFELVPVLAKGRGNYLSIRRLQKISRQQDLLLPDAEARRSLHAIEDWATATEDGSLSTLPVLERPEVWDHVRSDSDNCMGRKCPTFKQCFYQEARKKLETANLIVCNHALFFADLALRTRYSVESEREGASTSTKPPPNQIKAILPNYHHVIFDEAHGLEDAACEHFGLSLSMPRVLRLLRTLYSPRRRKGYLLDRSLQVGDAGRVDRAITIVGQAEHACQEFFEDLLAFWRSSKDGTGRLRTPNLIENPLTPIMRELAISLRRIREEIEDESERFELQSLARRASEIAECAHAMIAQTLGTDDTGTSAYAYWVEVEGDGPRRTHGAGLGGVAGGEGGSATATPNLDEADDDHAAWQPSGGGGGRRRFGPRVTLSCAPINVADLLRRHLFGDGAELREAEIDDGSGEDDGPTGPAQWYSIPGETPPTPDAVKLLAQVAREARKSGLGIVLTSATLATKQTKTGASALPPRIPASPSVDSRLPTAPSPAFSHAMSTLGIDHAETLQLGSPFDYRTQAKVIVDLTIPDPRSKPTPNRASPHPTFNDSLASRVLTHIEATDAGAFVLFTSFATMYACADRLSEKLAQRRWPMLVQGRDGSRQALLHRFLQHESAVLFGAASFWQGVDVRGERLRNVIITRLPFEPPDRPLVQARSERIELCGGNPFMQDSLPRAIIRFKQGFGRLIRSKTDRGQVVVLDPRLVTARYGRMFLDALPAGVPIETIDHTATVADTRAEPDGIRFEPEF